MKRQLYVISLAVLLLSTAERKLEVIALDSSTGGVVWRQSVTAPQLEPQHAVSNPAYTTAVTDGKRVYAYFGSYGLVAMSGMESSLGRPGCRCPRQSLEPELHL